MSNRNTQSASGNVGTFELRKPQMPMHNREVIEFYTPHIQLLGVQAQRKEETEQIFKSISKGTYPYGGKQKVPTNGKVVKIKRYTKNIIIIMKNKVYNRYKFKPDAWNMDGQIVYEPPFKDPEESKKDFFVQVEENNLKMSKTKFGTMQKNIDKRKQLEEKDIKYGNAKPKPNYSGFSDEEDDLKQTKDSIKAPQKELSVKSEAKKPPSVKEENKNVQSSQVSQQNKQTADNQQKPQEQDNQVQDDEDQQLPEEEEEIVQQDDDEQEQEVVDEQEEEEEVVQPKQAQQQQLQKQKSLSVKDQKKPEILVEKPQQDIPVQDEEEQQQEDEEEQQQEQDQEQEQEEIDQLQELSKSYASSQKSKGKFKSGAANMMGDLLSQV